MGRMKGNRKLEDNMFTTNNPHDVSNGKSPPGRPSFNRSSKQIRTFLGRHHRAVGIGAIMLSSLALLPSLDGFIHGDVKLYQSVVGDLLSGTLPYRDRTFEYPPYILPVLLFPQLFGEAQYPAAFMILLLVVNYMIMLLLLRITIRGSEPLRSLLSLATYCVAIPFLRFFLLQRYDLWPALISLVGIWMLCSERYVLSGLFIAAGIGVKVYPVLFVPVLFVLAARKNKGRPFLRGLIVGLLPMALLSLILPWWRFAQFHGSRGLQCESIYASVLWLGQQLGLTHTKWVFVRAWIEVQGPSATALLPWARVLFAVTVILSVTMATLAAARLYKPSAAEIARVLLVPLLAFVAFNQVLSPQYMIWILPLAALACLEGNPWPVILIVFAAILTPIFYPSLNGEYGTGLTLGETTALVLRNSILIGVWISLFGELVARLHEKGWAAFDEIWRLSLATSYQPQIGKNSMRTRD